MQNQIKFSGFTKSYRLKLKEMASYSDAEYRLFDVLVHIVDWDKKHTAFGKTKASLRDIQKHYLPDWSVGKIHAAMRNLIRRGVICRNADGSTSIENYWKFRTGVQEDEQGVLPDEQHVHANIQGVQQDEQKRNTQIDGKEKETQSNPSLNQPPVLPSEHRNQRKETVKTLTEHQTGGDENATLKEKLVAKYGGSIGVPLRRFTLTQVRDAARRMEAQIRFRGVVVNNPVGYITLLCKEGTPWEASEEKRLEDEDFARKAREKAHHEAQLKRFEEEHRTPSREERERNDRKMKQIREALSKKGVLSFPRTPQDSNEK